MTDCIVFKYGFKTNNPLLPKLPRDKNITAGTIARFDFLNSYVNPFADGTIPLTSVFKNMVPGGPDMTLTGATGFANKTGKNGLVVATSAPTAVLAIGAPGALDMKAPGEHGFMVSWWMNLPASGQEVTTAYYQMMGVPNTNANTVQWSADMGSAGKTVRFKAGTGSSVTNTQAALASDTLYHIVYYYDPATQTQQAWVNGVLIANSVGVAPATLQSAASAQAVIAGTMKGAHYCWSFEDCTLAKAADPNFTAAAWIAAEYANNNVRFAAAKAA